MQALIDRISERPWQWDLVLLSAIWGASFMFTQMGAKDLGVVLTTLARVGIATAFLIPLIILKGQLQALASVWKQALFLGMFSSVLPFCAYAWALQSITTTTASIANATTPLFGAVIAWLWLRDALSTSRVLGLVIGFLGVCALVLTKSWGSGHLASDLLGTVVCLLAPLSYGLSASYSKKYMTNVPPLLSAAGSQAGATVMLLPFAGMFLPDHAVAAQTWAAMLTLGVLCSGVAYILFYRIIAKAGPAKALTVTFAIPLFALIYGVSFLGETVSWPMVASALVIVCGIALATGLWTPLTHKR